MAVKDVPDGKQAWKVLEDITIDVDLVLTEVVMPSLSGIGLLGKIMNNRTFKDIPVISEYISNTYIPIYSINFTVTTLFP